MKLMQTNPTSSDRGWTSRRESASVFEKQLFSQLEQMGFIVALNGTEHTHPDFVTQLRNSRDQTSLAIRFQPDAVACVGKIPRSFFVEAKAAKTIERLAYEQYMKLVSSGNILAIVFEKLNWQWTFAEQLILIPAQDTVSRFEPEQRFPVVDGWIQPRGSQQWQKIRQSTPHASFTPYREVDASSLYPWSRFSQRIIDRLK